MILALNGLSALKVLRHLRQSSQPDLDQLSRATLPEPDPGERGRWSQKDIISFLQPFGCAGTFDDKDPLCAAVPSARDRLRVKGVRNTVYATGLPSDAFIEVGRGLYISSPELLFVELATCMPPEVQLLCGMELCGTFSRDAAAPRNGEVAYQVPPVTCVERIRAFVESCRGINGLNQSREALEWLLDNAWSPLEAVIAELAILPAGMLGYDLWPVDLNLRVETKDGATKASRVPDLIFRGTDVGLNYDGEGHLPLQDVVDAAMHVALSPEEKSAEHELSEALDRVRSGSVSDKRRDRELSSAGMTVLAMTKEDLYERGGLDQVMRQVIDTIERTGKRRLTKQRALLESPLLSAMRQELIWSLLPGRIGAEHALVYQELLAPNPDISRYERRATFDGKEWTIVQQERKDLGVITLKS